jgi:excisionase family DNA binding protein
MAASTKDLPRDLENLANDLRARGQTDAAETVELGAAALRAAEKTAVERGLLTTTEAAGLLGVRSVNTIKRWASDGRLVGYRIGSRVFVTRQSAEQMLRDASLSKQRAYERDLAEAYAPFEGGSADAADLLGQTQRGRTPWNPRAAAGV